ARNITHGKRIALHKAFAQCQIPLPPGRRQSPLAEIMNRKDHIRMKRYLPFVIIAAVLVAAVGGGYMMFRSAQPQSPTTPTPACGSVATSKGVVTIDEYGDYQCPPCGALHPIIKTLKGEY